MTTNNSIDSGSGITGQVMQANTNAAPTYSTSTYPSTNAINTLLYASGANTMGALATANSSGLLTNGSGVPAWVTVTGTGAPVLGTSPTITTPKIITQINDTNGNAILSIVPTGSAVNYLVIYNNVTGSPPVLGAVGTDTNINLNLGTKGTGTVIITATGGNGSIELTNAAQTAGVILSAPTSLVSYTNVLPTAQGGKGATYTNDGSGNFTWTQITSLVGRNAIINGDFQVWQRGAGGSASFSNAGGTYTYGADRWQWGSASNATACSMKQIAGATSGSFVAQIQRTAANAGTDPIAMETSLTRDMSVGMASNQLTISFKAKCGANFSAASTNMFCNIYYGTGSTDISNLSSGFAGSTNVLNQATSLTTTLTSYTYTISALPSTATQVAVEFYFIPVGTAGANDWFQVTDVQLEIGPGQTPFNRKPFNTTLRECQRFYTKSFAYGTAPAQNAGTVGAVGYRAEVASTTAGYSLVAEFPTTMLAAPTMTYYSTGSSTAKWRNITGGTDSGTAATDASITIGDKRVVINNPQVAGDAAGNAIAVHYQADIDLV